MAPETVGSAGQDRIPTTAARRSWWRRLRDRVEAWLDETEHLIEMDDRSE